MRIKPAYALYQIVHKLGYFQEVLVGNRPSFDDKGSSQWDSLGVDCWISVTDQYVPHPKGMSIWCPWIEELPPTEMMIAAVINLKWAIEVAGFKRIYLHCDAGTHRSPTVYGLYCLLYDLPDYSRQYTMFTRKSPDFWSDPIKYAQSYLDDPKSPWVKEAFAKIRDGNLRGGLDAAAVGRLSADADHFLKKQE